MALAAELMASRETTTGKSASATCVYLVGQTMDEREVRLFVLENTPRFYEVVHLSRQSTHQVHVGGGWWHCQVNYGVTQRDSTNKKPQENDSNKPAASDPLTPDVKISCPGRTQHVTQALVTIASAKKTKDPRQGPPDTQNAIGVSQHGINGCDIIVPSLTWTEVWTFQSQFITWNGSRINVKDLSDVVGRTNFATFRTFDPGEVMLKDFNSEPQGTDIRKNTYVFGREPNIKGFKLTPDFDPVDKEGHQYLDVMYESSNVVIGNQAYTFQVPFAVYVREVGRPGHWLLHGALVTIQLPFGADAIPTNKADFSVLGIGA